MSSVGVVHNHDCGGRLNLRYWKLTIDTSPVVTESPTAASRPSHCQLGRVDLLDAGRNRRVGMTGSQP